VIVGSDGWDDDRAQAVRTLVQAGQPLVLAQPLELSMLWAYELDMIRGDAHGVLVPCLPDRLHPFVARLQEVITAGLAGVGPIGAVESLHVERRLRDRSRSSVLAHLSRDADLIRVLAGDPAKLSTLGGPDPEAAWPTLAVGLTGPTQFPSRWQVVPAADDSLTIRLQGASGVVSVEAPDPPGTTWQWTHSDGRTETLACDRGAAILGVLDAALAASPGGADEGIAAATWNDAARAIELAETVPRSLAKGRSVDLHREEFSELGTFRGTMASLGCGLIMAALVVLVVGTFIAGLAKELGWGLAGSLIDAWPAIVLGVLGLFLLLQFLPWLAGLHAPERSDRPPGPT